MKNQISYPVHLLINRITFFLLLFLFCFNSLYGQECATLDIQPEEAMNFPWFGSPDYLPAFMDSLNQAETQQGNNISSIVPNINLNFIHKTFYILI